jgi:predicted HicB family RNase H-like nuclease
MMQYKGYLGKVEYDDDAKVLHGEVLGIRDVVTFQADRASQVEKAFHDSVNDYLAFCKQRNEEPQKPFSGQFVVRIDKDLHRKLALIAQSTGQSLNALVTDYLRRETEAGTPKAREKRRA